MRHQDGRNTICVSCMIGCPVGCVFCATGRMKTVRNLTANEMFTKDGMKSEEEVVEKIVSEIQTLSQKLDNLVIVTNNVFEDGVIYDAGTMEYLRALGRINAALAHLADRVAEVVVGIPVELKG